VFSIVISINKGVSVISRFSGKSGKFSSSSFYFLYSILLVLKQFALSSLIDD
jgi:hypothetical protein